LRVRAGGVRVWRRKMRVIAVLIGVWSEVFLYFYGVFMGVWVFVVGFKILFNENRFVWLGGGVESYLV
jgi:hypothetical protein